eukprot:6206742-Pleurochrysis_carterae.AAC.3
MGACVVCTALQAARARTRARERGDTHIYCWAPASMPSSVVRFALKHVSNACTRIGTSTKARDICAGGCGCACVLSERTRLHGRVQRIAQAFAKFVF